MPDRDTPFAGDNAFDLIHSWLDAASKTEPNDPNAMSLATVDADGLPNVRVVLLKEIEANGLVFYTNYNSAKGRELIASEQAAIVLYWKTLRRQIRARGRIEQVGGTQADDYFATRSPKSRVGAWASSQSEPIDSRAALEAKVDAAEREHGNDATRPPNWGGFRLIPSEIEFWADGPARIHDRFVWRRKKSQGDWDITRLQP